VSDDDTATAGYAQSMSELEDILEELEGDQLDVDVLAERVRRASELVRVCRERISRAQADVDAIVAELDEFESEGAGDEPEPDDDSC
jgi:exodeoxyribonuclease VII small subunit